MRVPFEQLDAPAQRAVREMHQWQAHVSFANAKREFDRRARAAVRPPRVMPTKRPGPHVEHAHGTINRYQRGCRCEACFEGQRAYYRANREKRLAREGGGNP